MGLLDFLRRNREMESPPARDDPPPMLRQNDDRPVGAEISYLDSEALQILEQETD